MNSPLKITLFIFKFYECMLYQVMDSLKFLLTKTHPLTLGKSLGQPIEFYTLSMEFSGQNQWLREKLIELDIEFSTDY
jgi:hypothetical protein